jgi:hypothetical protein
VTQKKLRKHGHSEPPPPPIPPIPPPYASILVGQWGVVINGTIPQIFTPQQPPAFATLITAIFRVSFDSLPGSGNGTVRFYGASNHGGNVLGRIVTGLGDFRVSDGFNTGTYMINPDEASGWIRLPLSPLTIPKFSFLLTNHGTELFLILTEPATSGVGTLSTNAGVAWGMAKRE